MRDFLRDAVRASLKPLEAAALHIGEPIPFPPIFIISLPRSGSTLLYLLAVRKFRLSYFSNFAMACPASPGVLTALGAPFGACGGGASLDNNFGETQGWSGPNQGYRTWNLWLPTDRDFIDPAAIPAPYRRKLRQTVGLLEKAVRAPFINKWQRNATRLQALHAVFPEAVFLHLRRNSLLTAQSVLLARRQLLANGDSWFSAKPRNYLHDPRKSQLRLAAEQVALLERDLEEDKDTLGRERFFELDYEALCRNPDDALDDFAAWYARRTSRTLKERRKLDLRLNASNSLRISQEEATEIENILSAVRRPRQLRPSTAL
jgi:hypothetical protein